MVQMAKTKRGQDGRGRHLPPNGPVTSEQECNKKRDSDSPKIEIDVDETIMGFIDMAQPLATTYRAANPAKSSHTQCQRGGWYADQEQFSKLGFCPSSSGLADLTGQFPVQIETKCQNQV